MRSLPWRGCFELWCLGLLSLPVFAGLVFPFSAFCQNRPILGAKVYRGGQNPQRLIELAKSLGVNTLFVGDELARSSEFRAQCSKAGLKYFLIVRTFNDPEAAAQDPTLVSVDRAGNPARRDGDVMICPSRADFREKKLQRIKAEIERLHPDGLTLDYFRYFIYWEGVDPQKGPENFPAYCFDRSCVWEFLKSTKLRLFMSLPGDSSTVTRELSEQIWLDHRDEWYEWRTHRIAENAREFTEFIRKNFPDMPIVLHAVPWSRDEFDGARQKIVGQDLQLLAPYFDYVSPMEYSALTHRPDGWVAELNRRLLKEVPRAKLLPSIEVGPDGPEFPPLSPERYQGDLGAARSAPAGVVLYHLELLVGDAQKQAITKRLFRP
jgi:hypothetical protein